MKSFGIASCIFFSLFAIVAVRSILPITSAFAESHRPPKSHPASLATGGKHADARAAWHNALAGIRPRKKGCFEAHYPKVEWRAVACGTAPNLPYAPAGSDTVGGRNDYSAGPQAHIYSITGSFTTSGLTSEYNHPAKAGKADQTNGYSLQINSNTFSTPACQNLGPNCMAWQQFIYASPTGKVFIQYWLLHTTGCPVGWNNVNDTQCYLNSSASYAPTLIPVTQLSSLKLMGYASTLDEVELTDDSNGQVYLILADDNVLNLSNGWTTAEFNIFGESGGSAIFNSGTTIWVTLRVNTGGDAAPTCTKTGTTAETNNLTLSYTSPAPDVPSGLPAIYFMESYPAGTRAAQCFTQGFYISQAKPGTSH